MAEAAASLAALARAAGSSIGLVTDFDGTLAPIVEDPAAARALPAALGALGELVGSLPLVAVVSGRPVDFLHDRIPLAGIELIGQYGLERLVDGSARVDPRAIEHVGAVARAAAEAEQRWPELLVERKGSISCTVHWRAAGRAPAEADLDDLARRHGLRPVIGRMACELRPPLDVDKGTVLDELLVETAATGARVEAVVVVGDDHGDLRLFGAADRARVPALKVAVRSSEAPPRLLAEGDLVVDGPAGVAGLLAELVGSLSGPR